MLDSGFMGMVFNKFFAFSEFMGIVFSENSFISEICWHFRIYGLIFRKFSGFMGILLINFSGFLGGTFTI